jgi:hypothetical protein
MNATNTPVFPHRRRVNNSAARQKPNSINNSKARDLPNFRNLRMGFLESGGE